MTIRLACACRNTCVRRGRGHDLRTQQIAQHIACADGGQLIAVPDEDDLRLFGHGFEQVVCQHRIQHRDLVGDEHIAGQGIVLVKLETAGGGVELEQAMDGLRIAPCDFGESFGGASGGRDQQNPLLLRLEGGGNGVGGERLAGAGTAGQDKEPVLQRQRNGFPLLFRERDSRLLLLALQPEGQLLP